MKLTVIFIVIVCLKVNTGGYAQTVTLSEKKASLEKIFKEMKRQTGYDFFYESKVLNESRPVDIEVVDMPIGQALNICFKDQPLSFSIVESTILVKLKEKPQAPPPAEVLSSMPIEIKGKVVDDKSGEPLDETSILQKGSKRGTNTNTNGEFSITVRSLDNLLLVVTHVGYAKKEVPVKTSQFLSIRLTKAETELADVQISTGMFLRRKESFTGATATYTGKQLKAIGNGNVLESLKTLDPSFIVVPNNNLGSNPSQLPQIQVRGTTSLTRNSVRDQYGTDPNQPLFILNGMQSTLQQIINLDINRIASITILKDAASTSLYGSKAANGVIVVETIKPRPGEIRIGYTYDFQAQVPDLRSYNMMNAAENLQFQKLAGLYAGLGNQVGQIANDNLYNDRLKAVQSGVNTYWLNAPLRNAFMNSHSLQISGGSEEFQYGVGLNYRQTPGVMKGSDMNTWGGSISLNYRKNKINVSNTTNINGSGSHQSPYGSFSNFVDINPYYKKKNPDGSPNVQKYLESYLLTTNNVFTPDTFRVPNPLYNASLPSKNYASTLQVQNILQLNWDLASNWRFSAGLEVDKTGSTGIGFIPSANTQFDYADVYNKGTYTYMQASIWGYQANVMLTFNKTFQKKHTLTGNLRAEADQQSQTSTGYTAVGFPDGVPPNPASSYGFTPGSKPQYGETTTRQISALGSVNYAYDNRFFADGTFTLNGSTVFGSAKKYAPYWSAGLGWTLSNEAFLKACSWLSLLRIRGNMGWSGNQQLGTFVSSSVYTYESTLTSFGQGAYLTQLGNPNLKWQSTLQISSGIDLQLFKNRLMATLNIYQKTTDPLIISASAPSSTGVSSYALNAGSLRVKGAEAIIRYSPIYKVEKNVIWTLGITGSLIKSRYEGFSKLLDAQNKMAIAAGLNKDSIGVIGSYLQRYLDGYSPDDLWAVRSLGIDPATGREVYLKKNGEHTFIYDPNDEVAIGKISPVIQGVISSNLNIKAFTFGINLRYSVGQYTLNTALYDKVENISFAALQNNEDNRALQLRWQKPGDIAQFKSISNTDYTPPSSRFIQKLNYLSGESINMGYEFQSASWAWIRSLKINSFRVSGYLNNIFYLATVKAERGIDYPYSNTMAFSLSATF